MFENDIKKINNLLQGKIVDNIIQTPEGITITFKDGTQFSINAFQYQMYIS